ncbi:MAG TPA: alkaline phosphatase family protein [Candidatus Elarobacter sp.]|nr:alkaline phosphatase family protein [Candidatus Elarobacter sp.]
MKLQHRAFLLVFAAALTAAAIVPFATNAGARGAGAILPSGWVIRPPGGAIVQTDTMPQGASASPDGMILAVVCSGFNPPALKLYATATLAQIASLPLKGAYGRPVWLGNSQVIVAGDNADALFVADSAGRLVRTVALPAKSHPVAIAASGEETLAVAGDGDGKLRVGTLDTIAAAPAIHVAAHPGGLAFSDDGETVYAADRDASTVTALDRRTGNVRAIRTGLHPSALLVANGELYVAESDADSIGVYDPASGVRKAAIDVGDGANGRRFAGVSPNAMARDGNRVFVSLGAANDVAVLRDRRVIARLPAGRYPTDVVAAAGKLFVVNGKGEGTRANPHFHAKQHSFHDYVAAIEYGSIRALDLDGAGDRSGNPQGAAGWRSDVSDAVVRPNGPIRHIFFVLKENRSYDQILGDVTTGNGDPKLVWFGRRVTPNQHALALRFGLFDNTYASGEVSDSGHNWSDAAFANDFVERFWPPTYGNRRDDDQVQSGHGAAVARNGYIWDAAARAHVTFRDYGEMAELAQLKGTPGTPASGLRGNVDARYVGWDLNYSDLDRFREWRREFRDFVKRDAVPQLEYIFLPNDHTYGSKAGKHTPVAYVATNDYAVGKIVEEISHSPIWKSSAVFIIEDDAQDGADHVSAQRTTLYLASPYAKGGLQHAHYSTTSVLRTIELILGIPPLSTYDAMAVPLTAAFTPRARLAPFDAIVPHVDMNARNATTAYGARLSARLDFSRPDAAGAEALLDIVEHNRDSTPGEIYSDSSSTLRKR